MGAPSAELPAPRPLSCADWTCARAALRYLERSRQPSGLCGSTATFRGVTLWDVGSQLGGLCAARGLGLLARGAFDAWMAQALDALGRLPLYRGELPNKCYDARTLRPTGYGRLVEEEIGFSALDLSRLARWLELVAARHPSHAAACRAVTARWRPGRLERDGELMGTGLRQGTESWWQEGRLGYAQYAASGLSRLGVNAPRAADPRARAVEVEASGVRLWADTRDGISPGG
ncbi:MAG TPA: DUF3131 domain-containing protein, partial [Longimicrobium sp.]|nr:DUF3131 domain-containing protein [Longimicrobium sp.]